MRVKIAEIRLAKLSEQAFTLVEVSISMALVATLFITLYAGIGAGFAYTKSLRENLRATQVMLERMEGIRLYNWDQLNTTGFVPTNFTEYYYPDGHNNGGGIAYTGTVTISPVNFYPPASYSTDMRRVTVQVGWVAGSGTNAIVRTRTMRTLVGRYGMQNYIYNN